jgi:CDP-6-deoxy-D-xylo-4-hexulose-3-dehydrase
MDSRERDAILRVIDNQGGKRWTIGPESKAFEQELASVVGVKRAVVTNSGSSALLVALQGLKLPKASKVIIPATTFPTAFNAILQANLLPYVVDVAETLNISYEEVEKAIKNHPDIQAVLAVNIAGNPTDLIRLRKIIGKRTLILDNCDGFGTSLIDNFSEDWKGERFIDSFADISCVSFHAAHIITMGEGGAVLTNNTKLADTCVKLREWGRASGTDTPYKYDKLPKGYPSRYVYEEIGYNLKPLELQCAMGRIQLKKLHGFRDKRLINHMKLEEVFFNTSFTLVPKDAENSIPCWFSFAVMHKNRKRAMKIFEKNNIEIRTIFAGNILCHPAYKDSKYYKFGDLPMANRVLNEGMFLSCHPSLTDEMIAFIGKVARTI